MRICPLLSLTIFISFFFPHFNHSEHLGLTTLFLPFFLFYLGYKINPVSIGATFPIQSLSCHSKFITMSPCNSQLLLLTVKDAPLNGVIIDATKFILAYYKCTMKLCVIVCALCHIVEY